MSKQVKHTPGPWRVGDNGATVFGPKTEAPSPKTIATLTKIPMVIQETKANARLIAAAPEMLEALKDAALALNHHDLPGKSALEIINEAIAKAEGRNE